MPSPAEIMAAEVISDGVVEKVRSAREFGNAPSAPPCSSAAVTSRHNWADFAIDVSSASSDQNEGTANGRLPARLSSNQDLSLACPYAKFNSIIAIEFFRDNGDMGRPRCWSKSYPNIPRLKQHLHRAHGRMTRAQEKQIKRKTRGISPEANWFAIWQTLFIDQDPPASPYFEDQLPLQLWDNALANDRERLSAKIKDRLHGALLLTQLQQHILDQTVQQAVAEYSGDLRSRVAQNHTPSGSDFEELSAGFVDGDTTSSAESMPHEREGQVWSSSMMQSYLPRSMLIPGMTFPPWSTEQDLSLGHPPTMQLDANHLDQQHVEDYGDLFLGLSSDSYVSSFDNTECHQWTAMAMLGAKINMKEKGLRAGVSAAFM